MNLPKRYANSVVEWYSAGIQPSPNYKRNPNNCPQNTKKMNRLH